MPTSWPPCSPTGWGWQQQGPQGPRLEDQGCRGPPDHLFSYWGCCGQEDLSRLWVLAGALAVGMAWCLMCSTQNSHGTGEAVLVHGTARLCSKEQVHTEWWALVSRACLGLEEGSGPGDLQQGVIGYPWAKAARVLCGEATPAMWLTPVVLPFLFSAISRHLD